MTDPDPRPVAAAATDPAQPVTIADIAAFTTRHARLRPPALGGDPAEYTALLAHKAKLLARIADQHARTDPAHAGETREITERAQRAVTARHTADAHDTTNVKDLQSPSSPGWGISLSNTGEFRRASSARLIGSRVRVALSASQLAVFDGAARVATHPRVLSRGESVLELDHYLEILLGKPGALPGSTALAQARKAGRFTATQHGPPRKFRTSAMGLSYAANCSFRNSLWTSLGVR